MEKRLYQLDSLRGLAALTVVFSHYSLLFPAIHIAFESKHSDFWVSIYTFSPIHIFWAGHEAVIFFFVLSGFVLSLPFYENQINSYYCFFIKRICRIYIPYLVALITGAGLKYMFIPQSFDELSIWANSYGQSSITSSCFVEHLGLINTLNTASIIPVMWSLVHEMRISLVFPLLMIFILRFCWKVNLCMAVTVSFASIVGLALLKFFGHGQSIADSNALRSLFLTLHYILMFVVGALLAKYRKRLINAVDQITHYKKAGLLCVAFALYIAKWMLFGFVKHPLLLRTDILYDYFTLVGVTIIIILSLSFAPVSNFLSLKPVRFIGKISYSIYLYHLITLFLLLNLLYGLIPLWVLLSVHFASTILVSVISYYAIEQPSVTLGKIITTKGNKLSQKYAR